MDAPLKNVITNSLGITYKTYHLQDIKQTPKPSQSVNWGAGTCAKRKSTSPCLLAVPAFDRIAELRNRCLNSNW
jgi:hypothetical protein